MDQTLTWSEVRWNEKTIGALVLSLAVSTLVWAVAAALAACPLRRVIGC
jgi:hypothetical protein